MSFVNPLPATPYIGLPSSGYLFKLLPMLIQSTFKHSLTYSPPVTKKNNHMQPTIKTPNEIREMLLAQGLNPERYRKFLEIAVKVQHENFILIAPMLSADDRIDLELTLMQGELGLAIVARSC